MSLPETGYVRINQIVGRAEVTEGQAAINRERGKGRFSPCPAIPAIIPWSKAKLWDAVKKGTFPKPIKLSEKITVWRVEDIRGFIDSLGGN